MSAFNNLKYYLKSKRLKNKRTTIKNVGLVEGASAQKRTPPWQSRSPGSGMAMAISKATRPQKPHCDGSYDAAYGNN